MKKQKTRKKPKDLLVRKRKTCSLCKTNKIAGSKAGGTLSYQSYGVCRKCARQKNAFLGQKMVRRQQNEAGVFLAPNKPTKETVANETN